MKSIGVVTERDLVAPELVRVLVERAAPKPRAQRAERLARLDLLLDREVDAGAPHLVGVPLAGEVILDEVRRGTPEALIDVQRDRART